MTEKFQSIDGFKDKKSDVSAHAASYLTDISFDLDTVYRLFNVKEKFFEDKKDLNLLNEIEAALKKSDLFYLTPHEKFYISKNMNNPKLILSYLIFRYRFKCFPIMQKYTDFPIHVCIEPTSICNLRCVMCFQVDNSFTGDDVKKNSNTKYMGAMTLETFKKAIDQADENGTQAISIGSRGEAFVNKDILKMLEYIGTKKNFFDVKINTNATALTDKVIRAILKSNVNVIVFSVDDYRKQIYEEVRVGSNFDKILANIKNFKKILKTDFKDKIIETRISGVYFRKDQNETDFANFWKEYVDTVSYVKMSKRWDTYNNELQKNENMNPCTFMWERLFVWWDGKVNICDEDYKSKLSPGNIHTSNLQDIWNGQIMSNYRKLHASKNREQLNPCDRCGV
tara:strand:+ start:486 stop:1673 length:1188 start_codon:yes stop_codon:yes gene_type:complete